MSGCATKETVCLSQTWTFFNFSFSPQKEPKNQIWQKKVGQGAHFILFSLFQMRILFIQVLRNKSTFSKSIDNPIDSINRFVE